MAKATTGAKGAKGGKGKGATGGKGAKGKDPKGKDPKGREIAPAGARGLAAATVADDFFGETEVTGLENVTAADLLVPRLTILQSLSPQLKPDNALYIEGAEPGQICDVGLGEIFEPPITFLPCYFRTDYLEWAPRKSGRGLVNIHTNENIMERTRRNEKNQPILGNGNLIAKTSQFFGLNLSAGGRKSFIPFASTQLKNARHWNTLVGSLKPISVGGILRRPPFFYAIYSLNIAKEQNPEGDWFGWKVSHHSLLEDSSPDWREVGAEAREFMLQVIRGDRDADQSNIGTAEEDRQPGPGDGPGQVINGDSERM